MGSFVDALADRVRQRQAPIVVGLDPRLDRLPRAMNQSMSDVDGKTHAIWYSRFCKEIIDVVACHVPAVKPQMAFFEQLGPAGMQALHDVVRHARKNDLLVILDGKRNDIGSTAIAYAEAYLGGGSNWGADALTVSPYLGVDSLAPFAEVAEQRDAGIFVLVKTSNPGGRDFQDLVADGRTVYHRVADEVERMAQATSGASRYGVVGAVVGATYPDQLSELRRSLQHAWLLVPGYGAQGGTAKDVVGAFDTDGMGALINASRSIIFAFDRPEFRGRFDPPNWQHAVELATKEMIGQLAEVVPGGTS